MQGDVTAIYDRFGMKVVDYTYDAWGNIASTTGTLASTIGTINPFRYRSYYYDTESGMYYLNARYYNPAICRFISQDSILGANGDLQSYNLYAYCSNNPVMYIDKYGYFSWGDFTDWFVTNDTIYDMLSWINDNISQPVVSFAKDVAEDFDNYDFNNESEEKVLKSNYFSSYKGVPVIRINGDRSGSFGAIFLTRETNNRNNPEDVLRHEYGHTKQFAQLGVVDYALFIGLPSWQQWGTGEYYNKPWEITADIYGDVQSRSHSQNDISRGFTYLYISKMIGSYIWVY